MDALNRDALEGPAGRALPHADPAVVEKLVEELKSQGVFDQFRKECLAEVDTKPAFQNLRSRVEGSVNRFLSKQTSGWKPSQNKNHLRNLLRKHIQESSYLESGMDRIVDQVVNPKILSVIEPQVEGVICNFLGVAKPPEEEATEPSPVADPVANGHISDMEMGEKLSNISSEDIEMRSAEDPTSTRDDPSAPRTASPVGTPQIPGGDISPLTPPRPPSPGSPHTPPLPPPTAAVASSAPTEVVMEEVIALEDQHAMSPVSDTDFDNVSPPKDSPITPSESSLPSPPGEESQPLAVPLPPQAPPPPPPPAQRPPPPPETPPLPPGPVGRPPSPLTSPIGSSSDDMDHNDETVSSPAPPNPPRGASSLSGPSDISDTDLPASNSNSEGEKDMSEADLNALEKARAELQAKLAAASIEEDDSEGEIRTDDDSEATNKSYVEKFNEIMSSDASVPPTPDQSASKKPTSPPGDVVSPISDSMSPLAMSKTSEEVKSSSSESDDDKKPEGVGTNKKKDGHNSDDDRSGNSGGASANADPTGQQPDPPPGEKDAQGPPDQEASKSPKSDDKKERRSSSASSSHDHKSHRSSKKDDEKKRSGHSHSHPHKSSKHRPEDKHRRKSTEDRRSKDVKDMKDTKDTRDNTKDAKDTKEKKKMDKERIEKEKIKLQAIEKKIKEKDKFSDFDMFAPKPPKPKAVLSRPPSSASSKGSASPLAFGAKSPLAFGSKTPPAFGSKTPPTFGSKTPPVFGHKSQPKANGSHTANGLKPPPPPKACSAVTASPGPDGDKIKKSKVEKESPKVERKVFPELPLPKTNGDKLKQHEVDILEAKQRLEEARQKRLVEIKKLELEKKQKKRSMSSSTSDSSPSSSVTHSKPAKSESKKAKVKDKPAVVPKERKKLTLSDLSDEEEVSDWSDAEAPSSIRQTSKRKRKPVLADSSEDDDKEDESGNKPTGKGRKRQTRTLALKAKADSILNSDPETKVFQGFKEDAEDWGAKVAAMVEHSRVLAEYLDDEDNMSLDEVALDELDLPDELLTLEDLQDPEATCNLLKGFGGHPTLTQGPPQWLKAVLSSWNLTRSDVNLFYQRPTKILSQVKPISEYAYNRSRPKLGRKSSPPVEMWSTKPVLPTLEPVLFDEPDFFGFESTAEAERKCLFRLDPDSLIDENGNTFGMKSEDFLDLEQLDNDKDDDHDHDHERKLVLAQLNVNMEDQLLRELKVLADEEPESRAPEPRKSTATPLVVNGGSDDVGEGGCSPQSSESSKENQEDQGVRRVSKRVVKADFGPSSTTLSKRPRRSGKVQLAQM